MARQILSIRMGKKPVSGLRMALIASLLSTPLMAAEPATETPAGAQQTAPATPVLDDRALEAQTEADQAARQAQTNINNLVDEAQQAGSEYAAIMRDVDSLNKYNEQLQEQIDSQNAEMASLQTQLNDIETTNREVLPLMERMVDTLEQFVAADLPFFREERMDLVARLKDLMPRADVAISEKYRRILEAYQIELDYGRTLEAYEGQLDDGRTVQFVKLGRISLMYQTLDEAETGYWDNNSKSWVVAEEYAENVRAAVATVGGAAPELLRVPVPAPQEAN